MRSPPSGTQRLQVAALIEALDARRKAEGISWRELARRTGTSPSTLTRMKQGHPPDVNGLTALLAWLGEPAESFLAGAPPAAEPHPLVTVLEGQRMSPKATTALESLVRAAYQLFKIVEEDRRRQREEADPQPRRAKRR